MSGLERMTKQSLFPDLKIPTAIGPMLDSVRRGTNAKLIRDVAPLYLTGTVLDVTYGEGNWWTMFRPHNLTFHDLHKVDGVDFRHLPEADRSVDTVCFDPPYVTAGGNGTSTTTDNFQDRFGIGTNMKKPEGVSGYQFMLDLMYGGLAEAARVARRWVLVKCMEYAGGGEEFSDIPFQMREWAHTMGLYTFDVIVHHTGTGPGGHNIFVPKRARRAHSYLLVFQVQP